MAGLNDLRDAAYSNSASKGFHDVPKSFGDDIALIHSEASEALEDFRNGREVGAVWYETGGGSWSPHPIDEDGTLRKPCGIPSELADIIIRVLDLCGKSGIDIERAVAEKMAYNATRPRMHGGKIL